MTSVLHIDTSFLPIYFGGTAIAFYNAGRIFHKKTLKTISYWLFILTSFVTAITCGFGGASIRAAKAAEGVDLLIVKMHAWTAMIVFLLSLALMYYSVLMIRGSLNGLKGEKMVNILSSLFLLIFVFTTILAYHIH